MLPINFPEVHGDWLHITKLYNFFCYYRISSYLRARHSGYDTSLWHCSSSVFFKKQQVLFIVETVLLTHWDLLLTSGRENYTATFFNIVQGVSSCHCWLCNSLRCQVQQGMPFFRSLCVLYDVRSSWKLWRASLAVLHHTIVLNL